jgi:uncharacterized membrane protein
MAEETEFDRPIEGRAGVARVEAFSDGVLAIIVTIMVLELKAPVEAGLAPLLHLWPTFIAYILSYSFVAIYWVNHHRLFSHAIVVTNGLLWSNIALLFALSLIPFSTSYLGEHNFSLDAMLLYLSSMLFPACVYHFLQEGIRRTGNQSRAAEVYHTATMRKGFAAGVVYVVGFPLSFISTWLGIGCVALVALFWMLPWSPLDGLFVGKDACETL